MVIDVAPPPAIYDHDYTGPLRLFEGNLELVGKICHDQWGIVTDNIALGCAWWLGTTCIVVIPREGADISRYQRALIWRHEQAHCNGWPGHHPR